MKYSLFVAFFAVTLIVGATEQDQFLARTGGMIDRPDDGKVVWLVNRQSRISESVVTAFAERAEELTSVPFEIVKGDPTKKYVRSDNPKAGVLFVLDDAADNPMKMQVSPDDGCIWMNAAPYAADGATGEKFEVRATKALWRAFVYGFGGGNNDFPGCLMVPAPDVKSLDAIRAKVPCPAPFNAIAAMASRLGIKPRGPTTYRQACREGWAPQPTNDCQQVIWNEIHAKPTKAMKIKFDPKRGK